MLCAQEVELCALVVGHPVRPARIPSDYGEGGLPATRFPSLCRLFPQLPSITHTSANELLLYHEVTICARLKPWKRKVRQGGGCTALRFPRTYTGNPRLAQEIDSFPLKKFTSNENVYVFKKIIGLVYLISC
ncbi:hypothetical protein HJG60_009917 [Phyllostomus discolor]|uniref:Uncharacterized protein n=1 Tax=Phyllostomus discolor TaxID=89673 RepID=A0A834ET71_9CHIR|nr:hypothetical protein HJG60_009917 [Phyllostomus discolor]